MLGVVNLVLISFFFAFLRRAFEKRNLIG